jgi:hypothetical protein
MRRYADAATYDVSVGLRCDNKRDTASPGVDATTEGTSVSLQIG